MPKRLIRAKAVKALIKTGKDLRDQLDRLRAQHRVQWIEHSLLVSLCDLLQYIRCLHDQHSTTLAELIPVHELVWLDKLAQVQYDAASPEERPNAERHVGTQVARQHYCKGTSSTSGCNNSCEDNLQELPDSQQQPQVLQHHPSSSTSSSTVAVTMAPPEDRLYVLRHVLSLAPYPEASTMSLQQLSTAYSALVKEAALLLTLVHHPPCSDISGQHALDRLSTLLLQHVHVVVSLGLQQRGDLLTQFSLCNNLTGEVSSEHDLQRHAYVIEQLQLSEQQKGDITTGIGLFSRLLNPVLAERQQTQQTADHHQQQQKTEMQQVNIVGQQLQQQQLQQEADMQHMRCDQQQLQQQQPEVQPSVTAADSFAKWGSLRTIPSVFGDSQQQQKSAARIATLLSKEYFLVMCTSAFVFGCLTAEQCARMCVLCWPWTPHFAAAGRIIAQQQQQQQNQTATTPSA